MAWSPAALVLALAACADRAATSRPHSTADRDAGPGEVRTAAAPEACVTVGSPRPIADPAGTAATPGGLAGAQVAYGDGVFAVAWVSSAGPTRGLPMVQRVGPDGTPLTALPVVLSTDPTADHAAMAVTFGGGAFYLVWTTDDAILIRRMELDGTLDAVPPRRLEAAFADARFPPELRIAHAADVLMAAWTEADSTLYAQVDDSEEKGVATPIAGNAWGIDLAARGATFLLGYVVGRTLRVELLDPDMDSNGGWSATLDVYGDRSSVVGTAFGAVAAWDGIEIVRVELDRPPGSDVRGSPFLGFAPSLARAGDGTVAVGAVEAIGGPRDLGAVTVDDQLLPLGPVSYLGESVSDEDGGVRFRTDVVSDGVRALAVWTPSGLTCLECSPQAGPVRAALFDVASAAWSPAFDVSRGWSAGLTAAVGCAESGTCWVLWIEERSVWARPVALDAAPGGDPIPLWAQANATDVTVTCGAERCLALVEVFDQRSVWHAAVLGPSGATAPVEIGQAPSAVAAAAGEGFLVAWAEPQLMARPVAADGTPGAARLVCADCLAPSGLSIAVLGGAPYLFQGPPLTAIPLDAAGAAADSAVSLGPDFTPSGTAVPGEDFAVLTQLEPPAHVAVASDLTVRWQAAAPCGRAIAAVGGHLVEVGARGDLLVLCLLDASDGALLRGPLDVAEGYGEAVAFAGGRGLVGFSALDADFAALRPFVVPVGVTTGTP